MVYIFDFLFFFIPDFNYVMNGNRYINIITKTKVSVTADVICEIVFSLNLFPKALFSVILKIRPPSKGPIGSALKTARLTLTNHSQNNIFAIVLH